MKLSRICALFMAAAMAINCTTPVLASEKKYDLLTPEYRIDEEYEMELEPKSFNSLEYYSSANVDIAYSYSKNVSAGTVRYISQLTRSKYFNSNYWGRWDGNTSIKCANGSWYGGPGQECFTSCISMSLSYIGVNKTPADILNFGGGVTIVNTEWGGAKYYNLSFSKAVSNFLNGNGKYSPPIIHLNNYSWGGHYVIVIGKISENVYQVLDPSMDKVWNLTMNGNTATYKTENGATHSDTVTTAHQYYKETSQIVRPFMCNIDAPVELKEYKNKVAVAGWAIYGKGITKVTGVINGNSFNIPLISRIDVATNHPGYPKGNEGFSGTIPAEYLKSGTNKLELYAYYNSEKFNIGTVSFRYTNTVKPTISNVKIAQDADGYTVTCDVSDDCGIDRVQFPTWTEVNGQDDLIKDWSSSELARGEYKNGKVTYRVDRSGHNNERGNYITHIYAYDIHGNVTKEKVNCYFEEQGPTVADIIISKADTGFYVDCLLTDVSGIAGADYEVYKNSSEGFELIGGGMLEKSSAEATIQEGFYKGMDAVITENDEKAFYRIDINACDIYGSSSKNSFIISYDTEKISAIRPIDVKTANSNMYLLFNTADNIDKKQYCESIGGSLLSASDDDEMTIVESIFGSIKNNQFVCKIATSDSIGESLAYFVSGNTLVISGEGELAEVDAGWQYYSENVKKIIIEEGITGIGNESLKGFINLQEVEIASTVKNVGNGAFADALSLKLITIPKTVEKIGENVFLGCDSLEKVIILGKETEIGANQFNPNTVMLGYSDSKAEAYANENTIEFVSLTGDPDMDGKSSAKDALMILKHAASIEMITSEMVLYAADVTGDGKATAEDALYILRKAAGM